MLQTSFGDSEEGRREGTPLALEPPATPGVVADVNLDGWASAPLPSTFPPSLHGSLEKRSRPGKAGGGADAWLGSPDLPDLQLGRTLFFLGPLRLQPGGSGY